jgi:hypothetical protein
METAVSSIFRSTSGTQLPVLGFPVLVLGTP